MPKFSHLIPDYWAARERSGVMSFRARNSDVFQKSQTIFWSGGPKSSYGLGEDLEQWLAEPASRSASE